MVLSPYDVWKTTPPEAAEPALCGGDEHDGCGEPVAPDDPWWRGEQYHLEHAPLESIQVAIDQPLTRVNAQDIEEAGRIFTMLADHCFQLGLRRERGQL